MTDVIFRKWPDSEGGGVIALFPCEPGTNDPATCQSFEHVGQHGPANPGWVIDRTRPATPAEYAALKRELESPPYSYSLTVHQRTPHNAARIRGQAAGRRS